MKMRLMTLFTLLVLVCAFPAMALDLSEARKTGAVGEKSDGFIAPIKSNPDVIALVSQVNAGRLEEYKRISKQNKQPVEAVGAVAAEQIINNLPLGSMYQNANGQWKKR
jgi:uncharacterized protein YdbL (DUF1318 family)